MMERLVLLKKGFIRKIRLGRFKKVIRLIQENLKLIMNEIDELNDLLSYFILRFIFRFYILDL